MKPNTNLTAYDRNLEKASQLLRKLPDILLKIRRLSADKSGNKIDEVKQELGKEIEEINKLGANLFHINNANVMAIMAMLCH